MEDEKREETRPDTAKGQGQAPTAPEESGASRPERPEGRRTEPAGSGGRGGPKGSAPPRRSGRGGDGRGRRGRRRPEHGRGDQQRHRRGEEGRNRESRDGGRKVRSGGRPQAPKSGSDAKFKREMFVNTSFEETRVAIVENDRLVEILLERRNSENIVGNIYKGKVENVLPGISSAFIDIGFEKNAYLYISDVLGDARKPIDQVLKKGQEVMIQVAKEAIGTKGAKITMEVTLPGRYLVFTPFSQSVGISKHISDPVERKRISEIVERLMRDILKGKGVVVRTEAEGAKEDDLRREANYLNRVWESVERRYESQDAPCLLHNDLDVTLQVARDLLTDDVFVYLLDSKKVYEGVADFVSNLSPDLKGRVQFYDGKTPIFTAFNVEPEIEKIRQTKVSLPNGGTIVIQEAESLCAIDVNTGRFTGSKSQEETVTMTNVEAAMEVAHQLRLRNIGGIIVIDFIDMKKQSNRQRVMEVFAQAVTRDRAKIRILPITRLGLVEMTRERRRESTVSLMTDECPECMGSGRVLSAESLRIRIQREIQELTQGRPGGSIRLVLHPQLASVFKEKQGEIEKNVHRSVRIVSDAHLQYEDYRIILE
ncbi:ribonuclease E/G [Elusimicrobiota bacterium]